MPERKPNAKSWIGTAFSAAGRFGRRMRDEWKAGEAEAGQPLPETDPDPLTPRAPGPAPTPPPWCEVLQIDPGASKAEIRQAYRRLIKEIHPDKVAHLSRELQAMVQREAQRLNDAYERALKGQ